jgi:hypothetical protein
VQILVIAVLMKGVMGRTFNVFQWEALLLLVAGITGARRRPLQSHHDGCCRTAER